jgi:uncharacterized membrane protein YbhN (UPF0104 family)/tRNA A-37 threonylcarbamoyl transferase component Bud32
VARSGNDIATVEETTVSGATIVDGVVMFEPPPARRRLAAGDVIRLLGGAAFLVIGIAMGAFASKTIDGVESDVIAAVDRLPSRVEETTIGIAQLVATFVPLMAVVVIIWRRRWRILLHVWLASFVAGLALEGLMQWLDDRGIAETIRQRAVAAEGSLVAADFPTTAYLASATAAVTVGASYLPRRWRRAAWTWIVLLIVLRLVGPGQPPLDVWIGVSLAVVVGSIVLLALGSPNPEPDPAELLAGLRDVGLDPSEVARWNTPNGQTSYIVTEPGGDRAFVKLRTPDDHSWDLLARWYRMLRLRASEIAAPYRTLKHRIEHEVLAITLVQRNGTHTPDVIAIGTTDGGAAFIASKLIEGRSLADLPAEEFDDDLVRGVFEEVRKLHAGRIAHRNLTLDNMMVDTDRRIWLVDLDSSEIAADDRERGRDVAEVLVAVGVVVGPERAIEIGLEVFGTAPVVASLPLLQPLALSRTLGKSIRSQGDLLDRLRAEIHVRTGADDVPLERLARVEPRTLFMIIAGALAFYSLLPQFGNLGETVDAFGDARWGWIPALLAAAITYFVFATISFLGSVAEPLPVAASARSQLATSFAQLVGPASAGKMALAGRFLQRNGLTASEAGASVALNTVAGVVTHMLLMVGFFAWSGGAEVGGVSLPSLGTILLVAGIAVVLIALAIAIRPVRRRLVEPVVEGLRRAAGYTSRVLRSPVRVAALLGGSTFITLSYLVAAVVAVEAFGGGLGVAEIGAAYLGAAAIANIAPTPGGLGALEAGMIAALSGFGLDGGIAISSVLTFRLATYWLPILPGWLTFMWMERHGEI